MLWKSSFLFFLVFVMVFVSCEMGQQLTNIFEDIAIKFEQLNWYSYPMEFQRVLPTILIGAQELIIITCFGIFDGSREQLKRVNSNLQELNHLMFSHKGSVFECALPN